MARKKVAIARKSTGRRAPPRLKQILGPSPEPPKNKAVRWRSTPISVDPEPSPSPSPTRPLPDTQTENKDIIESLAGQIRQLQANLSAVQKSHGSLRRFVVAHLGHEKATRTKEIVNSAGMVQRLAVTYIGCREYGSKEGTSNTVSLPMASASKKGSKRWTHFYSALQLAIQRSAHKWTFEDFTECFSVWVDEQPGGASSIFNLIASHQEQNVTKAIDDLLEEYNVKENIDILHAVVNEAIARRDRGEVGKDVWTDNLPPEAAIRARTIPLLEAERARLRAMLKELEDKNLELQDELKANVAACQENDNKAAEFLKVLDDVYKQCNQAPMDEIQQWAVLTAESTKPAQHS